MCPPTPDNTTQDGRSTIDSPNPISSTSTTDEVAQEGLVTLIDGFRDASEKIDNSSKIFDSVDGLDQLPDYIKTDVFHRFGTSVLPGLSIQLSALALAVLCPELDSTGNAYTWRLNCPVARKMLGGVMAAVKHIERSLLSFNILPDIPPSASEWDIQTVPTDGYEEYVTQRQCCWLIERFGTLFHDIDILMKLYVDALGAFQGSQPSAIVGRDSGSIFGSEQKAVRRKTFDILETIRLIEGWVLESEHESMWGEYMGRANREITDEGTPEENKSR